MWRRRTAIVVTALLTATSVVLGAGLPVYFAKRQAARCWGVSARQHEELRCGQDHWANELVGS